MAIIKSDATADTMTVDPTSKAQRETYYGVSSTSPSVAEADVQPTTVTATVISGKNEDVATLFRTDRLGSEATYIEVDSSSGHHGRCSKHPKWINYQQYQRSSSNKRISSLLI